MKKFIIWNAEMPSGTKEGFMDWEANFLAQEGIVGNIQSVKQALKEREDAGSTLITEQLALPHFKIDEAKEAAIIFVQSAQPIAEWELGISIDRFLCIVVPDSKNKKDLEQLKTFFVWMASDGILEELSLGSKEVVQGLISQMED